MGVGIPVLVKFNDLAFNGTVPLDGNLVVVTGNVKPYKVLAVLLEKCGAENVAINHFHVANGCAESVMVVSTSSPIATEFLCIKL